MVVFAGLIRFGHLSGITVLTSIFTDTVAVLVQMAVYGTFVFVRTMTGTFIHQIEDLHITVSKPTPGRMLYELGVVGVFGIKSMLVVLRKCFGTIMHGGSVIVFDIHRTDGSAAVLIKVVKNT